MGQESLPLRIVGLNPQIRRGEHHQIQLPTIFTMSTRLARHMGEIGSLLNDLPNVFSTPQWGGRAYKLPGPNGRRG